MRVCKESVDKEVSEMVTPCNEGGGGVAKRDVIDRMFRTVFLVKNRVKLETTFGSLGKKL